MVGADDVASPLAMALLMMWCPHRHRHGKGSSDAHIPQ